MRTQWLNLSQLNQLGHWNNIALAMCQVIIMFYAPASQDLLTISCKCIQYGTPLRIGWTSLFSVMSAMMRTLKVWKQIGSILTYVSCPSLLSVTLCYMHCRVCMVLTCALTHWLQHNVVSIFHVGSMANQNPFIDFNWWCQLWVRRCWLRQR